MEYASLFDTSDPNNIYLGQSATRVATSQPAFQIARVHINGTDIQIRYAEGSYEFDKIWDDRAGYTYQ